MYTTVSPAVLLCTSAELRPVFGVLLDVVAEDGGVDPVDEDQAAALRRVLRRVEQDPPRRAAEEAAPAELGRGVADGEADLAGRGHERVGFGHVEADAGGQLVHPDQ